MGIRLRKEVSIPAPRKCRPGAEEHSLRHRLLAVLQAALPYLRAIAERYGSTIHVVHVLAPEASCGADGQFPELDAEQDIAKSAMKTLLASLPSATSHTRRPSNGDRCGRFSPRFIEEKSIDLIVLGTHGRRGLKKLVLGSVAEQVFRRAPCPVLTVGPHTAQRGNAQASIATILFATDFSSGSHHALPYALSLARANHSHLILLHAVPPAMEMVPAGSISCRSTLRSPASFCRMLWRRPGADGKAVFRRGTPGANAGDHCRMRSGGRYYPRDCTRANRPILS